MLMSFWTTWWPACRNTAVKDGKAKYGAVGTHAHRLAKDLLHGVRAERDRDDLPRPAFLLELEGDLDGVRIEVADVELHTCLVDRLPRGTDAKTRLHVGDALDTDGDFHLNAFKPVIA
jgi:hypothetical protein